MGWPRSDERLRVYYERRNKTYLLLDPDTMECIGEVLVNNDPDVPRLASSTTNRSYLCGHCSRRSWSQVPEVWRKALAEWMVDDPEEYRGLWNMRELSLMRSGLTVDMVD